MLLIFNEVKLSLQIDSNCVVEFFQKNEEVDPYLSQLVGLLNWIWIFPLLQGLNWFAILDEKGNVKTAMPSRELQIDS